jgi:transcriptional regulator with XRE-family HTH domain
MTLTEETLLRVGVRGVRGWTDQQRLSIFNMKGLDRSYLSEIETGKKDPSLTVLKTIVDGFGMGLSQFLHEL